jgi:hypothetical protein
VTIYPRNWFINTLIIGDGNDWTSKQFNVRNKLITGKRINQKPPMVEAQTIGTVPVSIWKLKADEQSKAQPKHQKAGKA